MLTSPTSTTVPPVLLVCSTAGSRTPPTLRGRGLSTLTNTRSPMGFTALNCRRRRERTGGGAVWGDDDGRRRWKAPEANKQANRHKFWPPASVIEDRAGIR
eukprot:1137720-Pelagomonas_calceolata.AAC.12